MRARWFELMVLGLVGLWSMGCLMIVDEGNGHHTDDDRQDESFACLEEYDEQRLGSLFNIQTTCSGEYEGVIRVGQTRYASREDGFDVRADVSWSSGDEVAAAASMYYATCGGSGERFKLDVLVGDEDSVSADATYRCYVERFGEAQVCTLRLTDGTLIDDATCEVTVTRLSP